MTIIQFSKDIKWGAATASYQIEGAVNEEGRGPSIWDTFCETPGKVLNGDSGEFACDSYHRMEEDVAIMKDLGIDLYRFSIAWPRIYPTGTGNINQKGLDYYHKLVDALLANGIEPMVTLYHWDLPQALQDKGGWDNRNTIDAFVHYADTLFKELSGKVKKWITFNEPWCVSFLSNYIGVHAPGNKDLQLAVNVAHHLQVAHGRTVQRFRELECEGEIGFAPNTTWLEPFSKQQADIDACRRGVGEFVEWFFDPVFKGNYPQFLVDWFASKGVTVPIMEGDMQDIHQPIDFVGINYYSGSVAKFKEGAGLFDCEHVDMGYGKTDIGWNIYPEGFYKVLTYITEQYGEIPIYITENGACYNDEPVEKRVRDERRIDYLKQHLTSLKRSIDSGVNIKGYITWSLLDNFEWAEGYSKRFGIVFVNYRTFERIKKDSFYWYKQTIRNNWFKV